MKISVLAVSLVAGLAAAANADDLARWTFETSVPVTAGLHTAEAGFYAGISQASGSHVSSATAYSNPSGNGSVESFSSNNWGVGDYYQFSTSSAGYSGISITWDQTSSNTGPRDFMLQCSTDGITFANIGAQYSVLANAAPNPVWSAGTYQAIYTFAPVAGPASLDNQATIYFRMMMNSTVSANGGTVASAGTNRVDNIVIGGTRIPTPGTMGLLGLAGLGALRRRR
ncbi:MAG: hypothetical protein AABZ53_11275 [Planctomycetota bacterium]